MTIISSSTLDGLLLQVLVTPEGQADPYPYYARMREEARVSRHGLRSLRRQRLRRVPRLCCGTHGWDGAWGSRTCPREFSATPGPDAANSSTSSHHNMLMSDPPDHTRLRRLVSRSFTPRQVERLRPAVHELVDELLDVLAHRGEVDFMAEFALPLPMAVIGELVGVPPRSGPACSRSCGRRPRGSSRC